MSNKLGFVELDDFSNLILLLLSLLFVVVIVAKYILPVMQPVADHFRL